MMMKRLAPLGLLMIAFALVSACAHGPKPRFDATERLVMNSEGFLSYHPDLRWRREGVQSLREDRGAEALARFKRAARYADKPSQAMIAEMLWTGRGVPVDRPLAYAWMDIAAERAYIPFVAKREQYWGEMTAQERQRALEVGRPLMAEYGDAAAKHRLEVLFKRARRKVTGSRTGFVGFLHVYVPGPGGVMISMDGNDFYDEKFWKPEQYWELQDSIWKDPPLPTGHVDVLPAEKVRDDADTQPPPQSPPESA